jgi:hypothetical protein
MASSRPTVALFLAGVVLLAACGSKKAAAPSVASASVAATAAPTTVAPTTSALPATTTTAPPPPVAPLTGLPQPDASKLNRPALVVKIDNLDPDARPQTGLTTADVCFEEQVEGGITRFACVWQSRDTGVVGPVRSTRTTDVAIVSELGRPLYAFSGGNAAFLAAIRAAPIVDVGADAQQGAYYRSGPKQAPHNLFTRVTTLYGFVPAGAQPPPPLWPFRPAGTAVTAAGAAPITHADLKFPGVGGPTVTWDWDATSQTWKRGQDGSPDVTTDGGQISAANVIVQDVDYPIVGYQKEGNLNSPIPMAQLLGQGDAVILSGGTMVKAHWAKPTATAVTQYTDANGAPIAMTAGQTWIELAPLGTPLNTK